METFLWFWSFLTFPSEQSLVRVRQELVTDFAAWGQSKRARGRQSFVLGSFRLRLQTRPSICVQRAILIHLQKHTKRACKSQWKQRSPIRSKEARFLFCRPLQFLFVHPPAFLSFLFLMKDKQDGVSC